MDYLDILYKNDFKLILKEIPNIFNCKSVLEIGAGLFDNFNYINTKNFNRLVGLEIFDKNIEHRRNQDKRVIPILGNANDILTIFKDEKFDLILLIDIIEHLDKKQTTILIENCKKICNKIILGFSPEGVTPQFEDDFNLGNEINQTHISFWYEEDLIKLDFETSLCPKYHKRIFSQKHLEGLTEKELRYLEGMKTGNDNEYYVNAMYFIYLNKWI